MGSTKDVLALLTTKAQVSISSILHQKKQLQEHASLLQQGAKDTELRISAATRAGLLQNHLLYRANLQQGEAQCRMQRQQLAEAETSTYRLLHLRYQQTEWIKAKQYSKQLSQEKRLDREETDQYSLRR